MELLRTSLTPLNISFLDREKTKFIDPSEEADELGDGVWVVTEGEIMKDAPESPRPGLQTVSPTAQQIISQIPTPAASPASPLTTKTIIEIGKEEAVGKEETEIIVDQRRVGLSETSLKDRDGGNFTLEGEDLRRGNFTLENLRKRPEFQDEKSKDKSKNTTRSMCPGSRKQALGRSCAALFKTCFRNKDKTRGD